MALNQCLDFFTANPQIEQVAVLRHRRQREDGHGGGSYRRRARSPPRWRRKSTARSILRRSIEDDRQNFTRFFLLRTPEYARRHPLPAAAKAAWKTSLVFSTRNVPGALFRALSAFALRDLNLMKIESRPLRGKPWEYLFYLDFLGTWTIANGATP